MDLSLDIIQVATQVFEELKTTVLVLEIESLQDQKCSSGSSSKPAGFFFSTNTKTSPIPLKRLLKILASGDESSSWRNLYTFPVPLICKCPSWPSLGIFI